jgi:hypothetical protein
VLSCILERGLMNLDDHISGDVLTADEAYAPWTLAADDVFLEQMVEAAPAITVASVEIVESPWLAGDRIDHILSRFDDGALFASGRSVIQDLADLLPAAAPRAAEVERPLVDGGGDRPQVRPDSEEGPQVLPGVMDDDFLKLDGDHLVALPVEVDDFAMGWRSGGDDMVVYPTSLTLNTDGLFVPDHGADHRHGLIGQDDWLF